MKHLITIAALIANTAMISPAQADKGTGCHFHGGKPAAEATVLGCANQRKETLVKSGKLDPSWQAVKQDKIEQVDGKKSKEWKVTFRDPAPKDRAKETLYMFFTLPGNFVAANFTGQ